MRGTPKAVCLAVYLFFSGTPTAEVEFLRTRLVGNLVNSRFGLCILAGAPQTAERGVNETENETKGEKS